MRLDYTGPLPETVGFLLLPQFSMMAFFAAVEPLRIANRISGRPLFEWRLISVDGEPVTDEDSMLSLLENRQPGDVVKVTCLRDDEIKEFELTLTAPFSEL